MELIIGEKRSYQQGPTFVKYFLLLLVLFGFGLTSYEVYLNFKNSSLCQTESCKIIHFFDKFGVLNYLGVFLFAVLLGLTLLDFTSKKSVFSQRFRLFILGICLLVEGYFLGIQAFWMKKFCQFCLVVACLVILSFVLDVIYQRKVFWGLAGFLGFLGILTANFLVNVNLKPVPLDYPILVYQRNCPNCAVVEEYVKNNKIPVKFYEAQEVYALMRLVDLKEVPLLLYREDNYLLALVGKNAIINWLRENYVKLETNEKLETSSKRIGKKEVFNETLEKRETQLFKQTTKETTRKEEKAQSEASFSSQTPSSLPLFSGEEGFKRGQGEVCRIDKGCD